MRFMAEEQKLVFIFNSFWVLLYIYVTRVRDEVIWWHLVDCFIDDLAYEDLASDVAEDFDYYKDAIESRAGNTELKQLAKGRCLEVSPNSQNYIKKKCVAIRMEN